MPAAVGLSCATNRRHLNNWFGTMPGAVLASRRYPPAKVSSTIRTFSDGPTPAALNRRNELNAFEGLDRDMACLTLAKWETLSGPGLSGGGCGI
jgi:hypothetical protein